jgi:hypothetical protein
LRPGTVRFGVAGRQRQDIHFPWILTQLSGFDVLCSDENLTMLVPCLGPFFNIRGPSRSVPLKNTLFTHSNRLLACPNFLEIAKVTSEIRHNRSKNPCLLKVMVTQGDGVRASEN